MPSILHNNKRFADALQLRRGHYCLLFISLFIIHIMHGFIGIELDHESSSRLLRGLKGGSGGGGGGGGGSGGSRGSSSGGSYYGGSRGSTYYGSNSSSGGSSSPPLGAIIGAVIFALIIGICCCVYKKKQEESSPGGGSSSPGSDAGFDEAVSKARQKQTEANSVYAVGNATPNFESYEGDFDVKYLDRGRVHSGFAKIQLKHRSPYYKIEGQCSDADGSATITEGSATYAGDAWWVEETFSGADKGLKVLTEGQFDFNSNTFTGFWRANNGVRGQYQSFTGKNVSKTFGPGGNAAATNPQTLQEMLEEDIPMAVATVETPVVSAAAEAPTPVVVQAVPEIASAVPATAAAYPAPSAPPAEQSPSNNGNGPEPYVPRY